MSSQLKETQAMLAKHHRDGERFVELMKETFADRFDETFWQEWQQWVEPTLEAKPVLLDIGSGPGLLLHALAKHHPDATVYGVECAPYMLAAIKDLPAQCQVIETDLHDPDFGLEDNSVDAVVCSVVLHEMNQPVRTLQALQRCMKPGGIFVLHDWVRGPLKLYLADNEAAMFDSATAVTELDDTFVHFMEHNRYSIEDLFYLLEKTGFETLESKTVRGGRYARIIARKR